ncbi:MAG TPA: hypothetical protein VGI14_01755 [Casimicrobiaceae bacterium]
MFVTHDVPEAIALGDMIVVMSERPASVRRIIPVHREDRNRASVAFAHKLAATLECLGVKSDSAGEWRSPWHHSVGWPSPSKIDWSCGLIATRSVVPEGSLRRNHCS